MFRHVKSGRVNFCPGELFLKLLARIGEWHQNLSEKTVFYTTTPWYLIQRLIRTLCPSITNEQYLNTIAQGSSVNEQRKLFLFERCHKVIIEKWILLFKCPMKFHTFFNVAQLFYKGFCSSALMLQYLQLENKKQNYFLISQWITQCQHFSILLKIFRIIKNIVNHLQLLKPERE